MNEDTTNLQSEEEWDFEAAHRQRAPRGNRAIVSVGFKTEDFAIVVAAARKRDQPVSQFIREAALHHARPRIVEIGDERSIRIVATEIIDRIADQRAVAAGLARAYTRR